jgi:multimeric flavodoxin WrbA
MKILGINASPRGSKSQTLKLVRAVLKGAESKGAEAELVDICRLNIRYCNNCGICHRKGKCPKRDDFRSLYEKLLAADGLVMGSPNYFMSVTAQMKTLIDRMADVIHCQLFAGKYAVNVATAGGLGQDRQVTAYLNRVMLNYGCFVTGSAGVSVRLAPETFAQTEKKAFRLGEKLVRDIGTEKIYKGQEKIQAANRKYFSDLVKIHKDEWTYEYEFWKKAGGKRRRMKP